MKHQKALSKTLLLVALILGMCVGLTAPRMEKVQAAPLFANPLDVVISEVAWGGTAANSADEWIELYNNTSSAINLSGWTLSSNDASPNINLSGTIPAFGYFLLEADDDFTVSNIPADLIFTGSLNNTGETLTLSDASTNIIDTANISGGTWDAGSASPTYNTMERKMAPITADAPAAWVSNTTTGIGLDANNNPLKGAPHNTSIDLSVNISSSSANPNIGDTVTLTITLTNNGYGTATNVEVKNNIPLLTELVYQTSGPSTGTYNNTSGIWTIPFIPQSTSETLSVDVTVGTSGIKTVWAQVWKSDQKDPNSVPANNATGENDFSFDTMSTPISGTADISVTKSVNNLTPSVNDNVVFSITANNLGTDTATSVVISDVITGGLSYISDNGGGTYIDGLGEWQAGTIAAGASKTLKITARVLPTGPYDNMASVSSLGQNDPDPFNDTSAVITLVPAGGIADLRVTQSYAKASPAVAGNVVISITVNNIGPYNATNIVIKDKLPTGLTYVSDDSGGTYSKDTGLWPAGAVSVGASKTLKITAKVDTTGTLTNWSEVWSVDQYDPNSTPGNSSTTEDDDASVTVEAADLSLNKVMDNANPAVGQDVVFTITVSNAGPNTATNVQVKDKLPSNYTYSSDDSGGNYINGTGIWTVGSIPAGSSRALKITATLITGTLSINWAEVWTSDQIDIDSVPGNSSTTTDDDASAPSADLRLDQTVINPYPDLNTNFDISVTVTNDGPVGTTGVQVKDLLPSGMTYVSYVASAGTYANTTGIWTVGTLPLNGSATLTITAKLTTNGAITNWAEVYKSDLPDNDSTPANGSTIEDDDASGIAFFRPILINEVAWAGTSASYPNDQWVELYNTTSTAINITGWALTSSGGLNVTLNGSIAAGGFFLLEWDDNSTVSDVSASQIYTGGYYLSSAGETLTLTNPNVPNPARVIDTANGNGGSWPKGGGTNYATMERSGNTVESDSAWVTNTGVTKNGVNAGGGAIYGTPGRVNSTGVSPTPAPTEAPPYHYSTPIAPLVGRPIINEFLPRPNFDWNQDGKVDVFDEFIEITNAGPVEINIGGWQLDDEQGQGSNPYVIPSMSLKPGERVVFYGSTTNILLGDGGDTVRLISNNGKIYDAYTYKIAKVEDQSWCRIPDGSDWYNDCTPTPTFKNTRNGTVPSMPDEDYQSPVCNLPDTLPSPFLIAECRGYGKDIWQMIWDPAGWFLIHNNNDKWESFVE